MPRRKELVAKARKEARKTQYFAKLRNCPSSPLKMNQAAALIRGVEVSKALNILRLTPRDAAKKLEKLLKSAIANYEAKTNSRADENSLYVKEVKVDSGFQLKRLRTAPQGRGYRIRKRSNHVTLILGTK
ncbi:MAG: 50S ribosomal protein L22 [Bacteroidia bacterium]|nr:50S ribosomal protein L22 [Bacteroidia bacterium]